MPPQPRHHKIALIVHQKSISPLSKLHQLFSLVIIHFCLFINFRHEKTTNPSQILNCNFEYSYFLKIFLLKNKEIKQLKIRFLIQSISRNLIHMPTVLFGNWKKNKNLDRKISKNRDFKMKREWDWIDLEWNEIGFWERVGWYLGEEDLKWFLWN